MKNAQEIDTIMFNDMMNMITGDLSITRYISQNVKRSGLEIWRKLHRNNDPHTYNSKDSYRRQIEQLSLNRSKDEKELRSKFEELEAAFDQYERCIRNHHRCVISKQERGKERRG